MHVRRKKNWKIVFFVLIPIVWFILFIPSVSFKIMQLFTSDTTASSIKAQIISTHQISFSQGMMQDQDAFPKDDDLEQLLQMIKAVFWNNDLDGTQNLMKLFLGKGDLSSYSCFSDNPYLEKNIQTIKKRDQSHFIENDQNNIADVGNHKRETYLEEMFDYPETMNSLSETTYEKHMRETAYQSHDFLMFSPKEFYKKGYDLILSAHYAEAEKVFCAFLKRYPEDSLRGDALFWLAEALLGQKRYHEAAQIYLVVWYTDKKTLYGSEVLLKLAISMAALGQDKEACALFAKIPKHYKTLECAFYKRLAKERSCLQCLSD